MMNTQVTTAASGAPTESGVSGVLQGQSKKGGLFAMLMQAFQSHLKAGAAGLSADGQVQGKGDALLASLLQGKHGAEISALLAKLGKGDGAADAKLLAGLSTEALAALKQALLQQGSANGAVDLASHVKAALAAMPDESKAVATDSPTDAKQENGSSLQVALVAAGVRVDQSKLTTGGTKQQADGAQDGSTEGLAGDLLAGGKGKKSALQGKGGKATTGQATTGQATTAQATTGQATTGQATTAQATTAQATTAKNDGASVTPVSEQHTDEQLASNKSATSAGQQVNVSTTTTPGDGNKQQLSSHQEGASPYIAANDPLAKNKVVTIAKATTDDAAPQDDGVAAATSRPAAPASASPLGTTTDGSAARVTQQALATAQGNQHHGAGDQGSQNKQQPSQGGFESLISDLRSDTRSTARGAEFATQLGYKSAATWKPADAMLQIGRAAADGAMRLDLQLEPAHLGKLTVSIQSDASKQVQLHITVDNVAGRVALDQNMGQLRMALAQQGLDLGSFSMNLSSQGRQGQQEGHGSSSAHGERGGFRIATDGMQLEADPLAEAGINRASEGRLSILA